MNLLQTLHRIGRMLVLAASLGLIAGCASNRIIADGPHANLMLKGYDPVAYFTDGKVPHYKTGKEVRALLQAGKPMLE